MNPILKKLQLTGGNAVLILNAPEDFLNLVKSNGIEVHEEAEDYYSYVQFFAETREEADQLLSEAMNAIEAGGHIWLCYPRSGSELNDKTVYNLLDDYDLSGVSKVPLNDNWSAIQINYESDDDNSGFESEHGGKFRNNYDD